MKTQLLPSVNSSLLEVDHIFICVETAPALEFFAKQGLTVAKTPVRQQERGTASQIIFFENFYLEFIWVEDEVAAEIYAVRTGIDFLARSRRDDPKISPFGMALRQQHRTRKSLDEYEFRYSPPGGSELLLSFSSDNLVTQTEPLCFVIPDAIALPKLKRNFPNLQQQWMSHALGLKKMTGIEVSAVSGDHLTQPLSLLSQDGVVQIESGSPCVQLTFDNRVQRGMIDARKIDIPLILKF
ncbi:VOC family protein [Nostoc parmelioides]|uniref:VOC family protein n=1 Tax=Nostoc parmelioides FACHB-3921 TaxID=2692909 RepID=A0ABR8BFZ5_9NOSO|nr:VOC family protein [Nostoc parmelioides]MBD2252786.1 VOC family protein [Nostoc parmelioides FACHB-3921]